jgi:hypothetical protein
VDRFDFVTVGTPRSLNARSKGAWKEKVAAAAKEAWGGKPPVSEGDVTVAIVYFYKGAGEVDVDNIGKPIVDALKGVVLVDDSLASQVVLRKTNQTDVGELDDTNPTLALHYGLTDEFVYVAVGDGPDHKRLPL